MDKQTCLAMEKIYLYTSNKNTAIKELQCTAVSILSTNRYHAEWTTGAKTR